jgi:hypothetical protein
MTLNNQFYHGVTPVSFLVRNKVSRLRKPGYHAPHPHLMFHGTMSKTAAFLSIWGGAAAGTGAVMLCVCYAQFMAGKWFN